MGSIFNKIHSTALHNPWTIIHALIRGGRQLDANLNIRMYLFSFIMLVSISENKYCALGPVQYQELVKDLTSLAIKLFDNSANRKRTNPTHWREVFKFNYKFKCNIKQGNKNTMNVKTFEITCKIPNPTCTAKNYCNSQKHCKKIIFHPIFHHVSDL